MNVIVAKYIDEKLENLMQTNGLIKSKRKFESNSLFAIPYKDG
jgi:3-methyladenine DNA glycosylase Tag